nr:unnamed protein product [Callosobruchus chinensis]
MDQKLPSFAIFHDLAKAFDMVSFPILLKLVEDIGVKGASLTVFTNYLYGRVQRPEPNDAVSKSLTPKYGVPQGTILGPILFLVYVNYLLCTDSTAKIISFADDTVLYYADTNWENLKTKVENDFSILKKHR